MATQSKRIPGWVWLVGALVVIGFWLMSVYNGLVTKDGEVQNAWAQVETEYQRRSDLVPQLVSTVQGAAEFEQETFTEVTEARSAWAETASDPNATIEEQMAATNAFDSALSRLLVTVEAYPELNATENFQTLQSQLEGGENRIAVARKDFNEVATTFNVAVRRFPTNIIAGMFGFEQYPLFESDEGAEDAPEVDFDFGGDDEE